MKTERIVGVSDDSHFAVPDLHDPPFGTLSPKCTFHYVYSSSAVVPPGFVLAKGGTMKEDELSDAERQSKTSTEGSEGRPSQEWSPWAPVEA